MYLRSDHSKLELIPGGARFIPWVNTRMKHLTYQLHCKSSVVCSSTAHQWNRWGLQWAWSPAPCHTPLALSTDWSPAARPRTPDSYTGPTGLPAQIERIREKWIKAKQWPVNLNPSDDVKYLNRSEHFGFLPSVVQQPGYSDSIWEVVYERHIVYQVMRVPDAQDHYGCCTLRRTEKDTKH